MQRTLILVVHETDDPIDTTAEVVDETLRHIPIKTRPTVHKALPLTFAKLAAWIARVA